MFSTGAGLGLPGKAGLTCRYLESSGGHDGEVAREKPVVL